MHTWLLPLLRCPCCMSGLALDGVALRCGACARAYPLQLQRSATDEMAVPRLRRGDDLATLAQDVVVHRYDPESAPVEARRRVARHERRERFLAPFLHNVARPYTMRAAWADTVSYGLQPAPRGLSDVVRQDSVAHSHGPAVPASPLADVGATALPAQVAMLDRFVGLLPWDDPVLALECVAGEWAERLAAHGRRVVSVPLTPRPPLPQGARGSKSNRVSPLSEGARGRTIGAPLPSEGGGTHPTGLGVRGGVALIDADMMEMPFAATSLAGVWCGGVFSYVRPDGRAVFFRQIHRVLRSGGLLYLDAATRPPTALARQYLLWRVAFARPVRFGEYIYRLPPAYRSAWHYHAMTDARTLRALCGAQGFDVVSLQREGARWLLLARKRG